MEQKLILMAALLPTSLSSPNPLRATTDLVAKSCTDKEPREALKKRRSVYEEKNMERRLSLEALAVAKNSTAEACSSLLVT